MTQHTRFKVDFGNEKVEEITIHKAGSGYFLTDASNLNPDVITRLSPAEKEYQKLWCGFFDSIAIEARKNPKLQSQNIPKRFWKDTVELSSGK